MSPTVRRLGAGEADLLRTVRLRALGEAPMAFGSTLAREEGYEPEKWERWAAESASGERQAIFIAEPEAGMASGVIDDADPALAHLYAMWVARDARGTGAGTALVDAVVAWATDRGAERLTTSVTEATRRPWRSTPRPASPTPAGASRSGTQTPSSRSSNSRSATARGRAGAGAAPA